MSIRYTKESNRIHLDSNSIPTNNMAKQSHSEIDQIIQRARVRIRKGNIFIKKQIFQFQSLLIVIWFAEILFKELIQQQVL
jgi:hypothetical protein